MGPVALRPRLAIGFAVSRQTRRPVRREWLTARCSSPVAMLLRHSAPKAGDLITFGYVENWSRTSSFPRQRPVGKRAVLSPDPPSDLGSAVRRDARMPFCSLRELVRHRLQLVKLATRPMRGSGRCWPSTTSGSPATQLESDTAWVGLDPLALALAHSSPTGAPGALRTSRRAARRPPSTNRRSPRSPPAPRDWPCGTPPPAPEQEALPRLWHQYLPVNAESTYVRAVSYGGSGYEVLSCGETRVSSSRRTVLPTTRGRGITCTHERRPTKAANRSGLTELPA
jgi:hypothetical protein